MSFLSLVSVRRQSGTTGEGIGHAEAGVRSLLRPDDRQQRPRRDDRPVGGRDRARAHDTTVGARFLGLLTAVLADSSGRHRGLQRLVEGEVLKTIREHANTTSKTFSSRGSPNNHTSTKRSRHVATAGDLPYRRRMCLVVRA